MLILIKKAVHQFSETITSLLRIIVFTKIIKGFNRNNYSKLSDIVVIGNGPSLNKMISEKTEFLNNKDLICVNFFPSSEYFFKLKPLYLIVGAPDFWLERVRPELENLRNDLYKNLLKVNWTLVFYIPVQAKKFTLWHKLTAQNSFIKIHYYNVTPIHGYSWFRNFCYKRNIGLPRPHNILNPAIMMSIIMNYTNIYLWGAEHSWLQTIFVDEDNIAYLTQQHFYSKGTVKPLPMQKNVNEDRKLHEMLYKFVYTFEGYFLIREFSEKNGSNIWNCTPGSFIDAFKRLKI